MTSSHILAVISHLLKVMSTYTKQKCWLLSTGYQSYESLIYWIKYNRFFPSCLCQYNWMDAPLWVLTKLMEKKLDENYTRMIHAVLNSSWKQHLTKQQLYNPLPPISKTIWVRQIRPVDTAGEARINLYTEMQ